MQERLITIDEQECWVLLATVPVGRLAVADGERAPLVVPVNFVIDGDTIVFLTGAGTKYDAASARPVSFQADSFDVMYHNGWSVLVRGLAHEISDAEASLLHVEPWAEGDRTIWMRIVPAEITGRRIVT